MIGGRPYTDRTTLIKGGGPHREAQRPADRSRHAAARDYLLSHAGSEVDSVAARLT
jgi:hypothetical protein